MARIAGVDLPNEKRVEIGLTYIFGIGLSTSKKILAATGVNPDTRVRDLTEDEIQKLRNEIDNYNVEGDLRRDIALDIKRLMEINCYRGSVTEKVCLSADNAARQTPEPARVLRELLQIRRNN